MTWDQKLDEEMREYARRKIEAYKIEAARKEAESAAALDGYQAYTDLKNRIAEKQAEERDFRQNISVEIKRYSEARDKADANMEEYYKKGKIQEYMAAKKEKEEAETAIKIIANQIKLADKRPLVEDDEYYGMIKAVKEEIKPDIEETLTKIIDNINQCIYAASILEKKLSGVNNAVRTWQHFIYKSWSGDQSLSREESNMKATISQLKNIINNL